MGLVITVMLLFSILAYLFLWLVMTMKGDKWRNRNH